MTDSASRYSSHRVRKVSVRVLLWLAIGAIGSLAFSWFSVLHADYDDLNGGFDGQVHDARIELKGYGPLDENHHAWVYRISEVSPFILHVRLSNALLPIDHEQFVSQWGEPAGADVLPINSKANKPPAQIDVQSPEYYVHHEIFVGWPFRSWSATISSDQASRISYRWGLPYIGVKPDAWGMVLALPYRPLLPGTLLNATLTACILYAVYWLSLGQVFMHIRRLRTRKSMCPACGYDVHCLTTCPECGEPVPERVPKRNTIGS